MKVVRVGIDFGYFLCYIFVEGSSMKQIEKNFFAIDINTNYNMGVVQGEAVAYVICRHVTDKSVIKDLANKICDANIKDVCFFGEQEKLWHWLFDEVDIERQDLSNNDDVLLTSSVDTTDEFVEELCINKNYCNTFLFFDDKKIFDEVVEKVDNYSDDD